VAARKGGKAPGLVRRTAARRETKKRRRIKGRARLSLTQKVGQVGQVGSQLEIHVEEGLESPLRRAAVQCAVVPIGDIFIERRRVPRRTAVHVHVVSLERKGPLLGKALAFGIRDERPFEGSSDFSSACRHSGWSWFRDWGKHFHALFTAALESPALNSPENVHATTY
jgi:hypothetical protein